MKSVLALLIVLNLIMAWHLWHYSAGLLDECRYHEFTYLHGQRVTCWPTGQLEEKTRFMAHREGCPFGGTRMRR